MIGTFLPHAEVDRCEFHCDGMPEEEDRREEEERLHAPARRLERSAKQTLKGALSESEQASSLPKFRGSK